MFDSSSIDNGLDLITLDKISTEIVAEIKKLGVFKEGMKILTHEDAKNITTAAHIICSENDRDDIQVEAVVTKSVNNSGLLALWINEGVGTNVLLVRDRGPVISSVPLEPTESTMRVSRRMSLLLSEGFYEESVADI